MNKLSLSLLLAGVGLIIALTAFAGDDKDKSKTKEVFPSKIETFVEQNIPDGRIVKFNHDGEKMEVKCNDHTELCFNSDGECIKIENDKNGINPKLIGHLPNAAVIYLKNNYNNVAITEIEKKSYGFKVELRTSPNDCDIWFNNDGSVRKECDY
ncbi:MAG: PepSY-like domain-containing protein [Bacteroidales bacterium]|nr:PepSY-like domain-containing protein [Bacteroidales bacterium]